MVREQRRALLTAVIMRPKPTEDAYGDETDHPISYSVEGCQFDPDHLGQTARSGERTAPDEVRVVRTGVLNIPGVHQLTADDTATFLGSVWQIVGHGQVYLDRTKVRVQQARER